MYISKFQEFKQKILLNTWDEDIASSEYNLPDPPNKKDIFGYNLSTAQQKWRVPHIHLLNPHTNCWEPKAFNKLNEREQDDFEEQEVKRRINGFWFYNHGKITWVTGVHYFYMAHWYIDCGYPEFRSRDKDFYYFWDLVDKDPNCFGMAYVKHRREGATYRAGCINYERISRMRMAHGGIQSKTEGDAQEVFKKAIVGPWRKLPRFFRPIYSGSTNPSTSLPFFEPAQRVSSKATFAEIEDESLESWIDYGASTEYHYDGPKLQFIHHDEVGKTKEVNVYKRYGIVKECLNIGKKIIGKALLTSTVAEMEKEGGASYKKIWDESDIRKRDTNGRTMSGLYKYFAPAYHGLEGFVDEYGESMIEEAKEFLNAKRTLYQAERKWDKLNEEKRLYPQKSKEAFQGDSKKCAFNLEKITIRKDHLEGKHDEIWEQGYLEWVPVMNADGKTYKYKDTYVRFVPSSNGRFYINRKYLDLRLTNKVKKHWNGQMMPDNNDNFSIGIDPYDHLIVKDQNPSNGSSHGMRKYDPMIDPEDKPIDKWQTFRFVVKYCARPGVTIFYEDMIMMVYFLGCEALIEKNKQGIYKHFYERGYELFLANRPESAFGASASTQNSEEIGVDGSPLLKEAMFEQIDKYVENYYELVDDEEVLDDWEKADIQHLTKFDRTVSSGLCLLLTKKYLRPKEQVNKTEKLAFVNVYNNKGLQSQKVR